MTPHRFLPHTADIQVELTAKDLAGLYQAGADAVRELLVGGTPVGETDHRTIALAGPDDGGARLMDFLRELVYLYDVERFLPHSVTVDDAAGAVRVTGELLDPRRHQAERELKGVTHHGFRLERKGEGFTALVIFDV